MYTVLSYGQAKIQILIFLCHLKPVTAQIETEPKIEVYCIISRYCIMHCVLRRLLFLW